MLGLLSRCSKRRPRSMNCLTKSHFCWSGSEGYKVSNSSSDSTGTISSLIGLAIMCSEYLIAARGFPFGLNCFTRVPIPKPSIFELCLKFGCGLRLGPGPEVQSGKIKLEPDAFSTFHFSLLFLQPRSLHFAAAPSNSCNDCVIPLALSYLQDGREAIRASESPASNTRRKPPPGACDRMRNGRLQG